MWPGSLLKQITVYSRDSSHCENRILQSSKEIMHQFFVPPVYVNRWRATTKGRFPTTANNLWNLAWSKNTESNLILLLLRCSAAVQMFDVAMDSSLFKISALCTLVKNRRSPSRRLFQFTSLKVELNVRVSVWVSPYCVVQCAVSNGIVSAEVWFQSLNRGVCQFNIQFNVRHKVIYMRLLNT